jgi:hypothetical protein
MSDSKELPEALQNSTNDHAAAVSKALLGMVPYAGSLLAELAGSLIPNQRMERVAKFAAILEERLKGVEDELLKKRWQDDRFLELAEEVVRQAARATSDERRTYLAEVLAKEMTGEQLEENDSRHLLRILGELNDVEVVWLRYYARNHFEGFEEFSALHKDIIQQKSFDSYSSEEARISSAALKESYINHLVQLGLMNEDFLKNTDGTIEMQMGGSRFRVNRHPNHLADMMLEMIGFKPFR